MRKFIMILLILPLLKITAFSQNISNGISNDSTIVLITSNQLKEANLIFAEHKKLLIENKLLYKQLENYKLDNQSLITIDSLYKEQINSYIDLSKTYESEINNLNKQIKTNNSKIKLWTIGGITICTSLLLLLLIK